MADRGDVLRLKRRLGFGSDEDGDLVVVVQSTALNAALPTTVVVPLDPNPSGAPSTLAVVVTARENGSDRDCIAIPTHLKVLILDRFAPGRVGRLRPRTLVELESKLMLVLDL
jgi:mRNA-degrading endonuclease toxin of MazEF toxin-antitoxin module